MTDGVVLAVSSVDYQGKGKVKMRIIDQAHPEIGGVDVVVDIKGTSDADLQAAITKATDSSVDWFAAAIMGLEVAKEIKSKWGSGPKVVYSGKLSAYKKGGKA